MDHSCGVCFLAFALCLVACVSASTGVKAPTITVEDATTAVNAAKKSAEEVFDKAQSEVDKAKAVLDRLEAFETEAKKAESQAAQAADQAKEAAKSDTEAAAIVTNLRNIAKTVITLHTNAKGEQQKALNILNAVLETATKLKANSNIALVPNDTSENAYTAENKKALEITQNATELENDINKALKIMGGVPAVENNMKQNWEKTQVGTCKVIVIVAVANIQTMKGDADSIIKQTENKKDEIDVIVKEMQELKAKSPRGLLESFDALIKSAEGELSNAKSAVENFMSAKEAIEEQKLIADAALQMVKTATEVSKAQVEVNNVNGSVEKVKGIIRQLNSALETTSGSVITANASKQKMETDLLTATSATHNEQSSTHSQVKTLKGSVSAAVTEIQTMMGEADSILLKTENHKQTVHDIVQEMQTLKTTAKIESNDINELCKNAEDELTKATGAVEKVKTEKEAMRKEKVIADAALKDVNAATEINKTQPHVAAATSCLDKVKENLSQLSIALKTAENSVAKANELKQKLKTILSTTTAAPRTKEVKETEKADLPVGEGTESDVKDTKTQPTSKDSPIPSDNTSEEIKQTLIKGAQNVPTTALTGGKAPAPDAKNDSAMTVSVPLLVALIASAVLQ